MIPADAFDEWRRVVVGVTMAAALIDACAEATQSQRSWRRALSAEGTASDILGAWGDTPLTGPGADA